MELATMTKNREDAWQKVESYRKWLGKRSNEEYYACLKGYEALAEGAAILDVGDAIRTSVRDEKGRPRLAIARADRTEVRLSWWLRHRDAEFDSGTTQYRESMIERIDMGATPLDHVHGYAMVPMVPPNVRPKVNLRGYHILWEVEEWADNSHEQQPDRDPYLLERISGPLFTVVAAWDLTDLEQWVMSTRSQR